MLRNKEMLWIETREMSQLYLGYQRSPITSSHLSLVYLFPICISY